jgi:hypothetical protein
MPWRSLTMRILAVKGHGAVVGRFQEVDATQEGAFARAAGADQADHVAGLGLERDTLSTSLSP